MHRRVRPLVLPALAGLSLLLRTAPLPAQSPAEGAPPPRIYGGVAVSERAIAFIFGGQLWEVPRGGGTAERRSTMPDEHGGPLYSRDGRQLAFTRANALWVMPAGGGQARRLTWYPRAVFPRDWSPRGDSILFASSRDGDGNMRAFVVPATGGAERMLPLDPVRFASWSPDGRRMAVVGWSPFLGGVDRRYYRGGLREPIALLDPTTGRGTHINAGDVNQILPMWTGGTVYFASDSLGAFNLAAYDTLTRRSRLLTRWRRHGIVAAAQGGGAIAFVRDGRIHVYDIASGRITTPAIEIPASDTEAAPRVVAAAPFVQSITAGPNGDRIALEARGDVILASPDGSGAVNLTRSPGVADRLPVISPDGRQVAWFSDSGGEYALAVQPLQDGGAARRISLGTSPTYFRGLTWSEDSRRIAFSDQRLVLWVADIAAGRATPVDSSRWIAQDVWQASWSPDGRLLAYAKADPKGIRAVWVRDLERGEAVQVSSGGTDDTWPVFDPTGRWLFFASSSSSGVSPARDVWSLESDLLAQPLVSSAVVVAVLRRGDGYPMLPYGAGPNPAAQQPATGPLDLAGASRRVARLGTPSRKVDQLWMAADGALIAQVVTWAPASPYGSRRTELLRIEASAPTRPQVIARDLTGVELSSDRRAALLVAGNARRIRRLVSDSVTMPIVLDSLRMAIDARQEWGQLYRESFRMMRDYFYDPAHHGTDLRALEAHYAAYLPQLRRRTDLNDLLLYAFGEVSVSHLGVAGGDMPQAAPPNERIGVLGADLTVSAGLHRIARIVPSAPHHHDNALLQSPLDQPGVDARVGDYVLAVDGVPVRADVPLEAALVGKAYRATTLRLAASPGGEDAREVRVVPSGGENGLRRAAWAEANRREVERRSGGRLAYVHIGAWSFGGMEELWRVLHGARGAEGLIIDERYNGGGVTMDAAIEMLRRTPAYDYLYRYGDGFAVPHHLVTGPKVLITHEGNFSAAETFALMFKERGVGTIVGRRTGGGGIGGALFQQRLIDGGRITIPNRASHNSRTGSWDIENFGVTPDIDVPRTQEDAVAGRDPQLDRAITEALERLSRQRPAPKRRPAMPVHPPR